MREIAESNPPTEDSTALRDLTDWVVEHGGLINEHLELTSDPSAGYSFRVRARGSVIHADRPLLSCPYALSISYLNTLDRAPFHSRAAPFPTAFLREVSPHTVTVFFLCQQFLLGQRSFWWPYIRTLPAPDQRDRLGTPLYFTDEDQLWIKGTNLHPARADRERDWREQFDRGVDSLTREAWVVDGYTWSVHPHRLIDTSRLIDPLQGARPLGRNDLELSKLHVLRLTREPLCKVQQRQGPRWASTGAISARRHPQPSGRVQDPVDSCARHSDPGVGRALAAWTGDMEQLRTQEQRGACVTASNVAHVSH